MNLIKIDDLKGHIAFGNKGDVWNNTIHITETGFTSETLCGKVMLSNNWARKSMQEELGFNHEFIGCTECARIYAKKNHDANN